MAWRIWKGCHGTAAGIFLAGREMNAKEEGLIRGCTEGRHGWRDRLGGTWIRALGGADHGMLAVGRGDYGML